MTLKNKIRYLEPAYLSSDDMPWHPFTPYSETVFVKLLRVDYRSGEVVLMLKAPANQKLGTHIHHGPLIVYTLAGNWMYPEHDWKAKAGDLVYEISDSKHTFQALEGEEVQVFIVLNGALEFIDEAGNTTAIETLHSWIERYEAYCIANGLEIRDLSSFPEEKR